MNATEFLQKYAHIYQNTTAPQFDVPPLVQKAIDYIYMSYAVHTFDNLIHAVIIHIVFTIIGVLLLRPVVLFLYRISMPSPSAKPWISPSMNAKLDWLFRLSHIVFDGVHYFWTLAMVLITIPYTRMNGAPTWNCYWAWVLQMVTTLLLMIRHDTPKSRVRTFLRNFGMNYFLYFANGVMAFANFGYLYYRFASYTWPYMFVHFAPPAFIWFYCSFKIAIIPEHQNPLLRSFLHTLGSLLIADIFQLWYVKTVDFLQAYDMQSIGMPYLFTIGGVAPSVANLAVLLILTFSRVFYIRLFGYPEDASIEKKTN